MTWLAAANADDVAGCHSHRRVGLVVLSASVRLVAMRTDDLAWCRERKHLFWRVVTRADDLACCHVREHLTRLGNHEQYGLMERPGDHELRRSVTTLGAQEKITWFWRVTRGFGSRQVSASGSTRCNER